MPDPGNKDPESKKKESYDELKSKIITFIKKKDEKPNK